MVCGIWLDINEDLKSHCQRFGYCFLCPPVLRYVGDMCLSDSHPLARGQTVAQWSKPFSAIQTAQWALLDTSIILFRQPTNSWNGLKCSVNPKSYESSRINKRNSLKIISCFFSWFNLSHFLFLQKKDGKTALLLLSHFLAMALHLASQASGTRFIDIIWFIQYFLERSHQNSKATHVFLFLKFDPYWR